MAKDAEKTKRKVAKEAGKDPSMIHPRVNKEGKQERTLNWHARVHIACERMSANERR